MRNLVPLLGLAAALSTSSCQAFGAARGVAIVAALLTGALAWLVHRGHARAGGEAGSTGASATDTDTTASSSSGTGTTDATGSGPAGSTGASSGSLDSTASSGTGDATSPADTTWVDAGSDVGPCLSIAPPDGVCDCETDGDRTAADWAPALLLPALARRRRSRRTSLDRLSAAGRLPPDVVARLRQRLEDDHRAE